MPAEAIVGAMEAYFGRRAKRAKTGGYVSLAHLAKDVAKAVKLRAALARTEVAAAGGWDAAAAFWPWKSVQVSVRNVSPFEVTLRAVGVMVYFTPSLCTA